MTLVYSNGWMSLDVTKLKGMMMLHIQHSNLFPSEQCSIHLVMHLNAVCKILIS